MLNLSEEEFNAKYGSLSISDFIAEFEDDWLEGMIKSGELFRTDIYDLTELMDKATKLELFEKINSLSLVDLVFGYGHEKKMVESWLERYKYYHIIFRKSNNQLTTHSNTNQQILLYYYLKELQWLNLEEIGDQNKVAKFLHLFLNRDESNIRKALRNANIKGEEKKYYTKVNIRKIIEMATAINCKEIKQLAERDYQRLYGK